MRNWQMNERNGSRRIHDFCLDLIRRSDGQELVEYSMLVSLVSLVAVGTVASLSVTIGGVFQIVSTGMQQ